MAAGLGPGMEITILDDDSRYDPTLVDVKRRSDRFILAVRHAEPAPFTVGDRAEMVLASEAYLEGDASDFLRRRKEVSTVAGRCVKKLSDITYSWEVGNVSEVDEVLDADPESAFFD